MLSKKVDTEELKNQLVRDTKIVGVLIFFGEKDKIDDLAKEGKTEKKISYIKLKSYKKRGHDWLTRPYHFAKGIGLHEEWSLSKERKSTIEYKRASNIFYKGRKQRTISKNPYKIKRYQNWSGDKIYPKLFKKFFGYKTPEHYVLKKDKWKIPGEIK